MPPTDSSNAGSEAHAASKKRGNDSSNDNIFYRVYALDRKPIEVKYPYDDNSKWIGYFTTEDIGGPPHDALFIRNFICKREKIPDPTSTELYQDVYIAVPLRDKTHLNLTSRGVGRDPKKPLALKRLTSTRRRSRSASSDDDHSGTRGSDSDHGTGSEDDEQSDRRRSRSRSSDRESRSRSSSRDSGRRRSRSRSSGSRHRRQRSRSRESGRRRSRSRSQESRYRRSRSRSHGAKKRRSSKGKGKGKSGGGKKSRKRSPSSSNSRSSSPGSGTESEDGRRSRSRSRGSKHRRSRSRSRGGRKSRSASSHAPDKKKKQITKMIAKEDGEYSRWPNDHLLSFVKGDVFYTDGVKKQWRASMCYWAKNSKDEEGWVSTDMVEPAKA